MLKFKRDTGQHIPIKLLHFTPEFLDSLEDSTPAIIDYISLLPTWYQIQLLKKLLQFQQVEFLIVYLSSLFIVNSKGYKVFVMPWGLEIKLVEDREMISQGTTGLSTWGASLYLLEYFNQHHYLIQGKRVLELGAGLGLLSIAMSGMGADVLATDVSIILSRLSQNCLDNQSQVRVEELNWYEPTLEWTGDLIVCADVVYDPCLIEPLLTTIKKYDCECIMALTKRNEQTWELLMDRLTRDFVVKTDTIQPNWFYYQEASPIQVFILNKMT